MGSCVNSVCCALAAGLLEEMPFSNISDRLNPAAFPDAKDLANNASLGNLATLAGEAWGGRTVGMALLHWECTVVPSRVCVCRR